MQDAQHGIIVQLTYHCPLLVLHKCAILAFQLAKLVSYAILHFLDGNDCLAVTFPSHWDGMKEENCIIYGSFIV